MRWGCAEKVGTNRTYINVADKRPVLGLARLREGRRGNQSIRSPDPC
jgi:hypothetical protein